MRVLIRCDASAAIGSGHVMRCRNLGHALKWRSTEVIFLCRERQGDLNTLLDREFDVLRLPELPDPEQSLEALKGRDLYSAWLGCSQSQDINDCLNAINLAEIGPIDWLVVDHYGLDQKWERQMCTSLSKRYAKKTRLLVFDDLVDRPHQADVLVDANQLDSSAYGPTATTSQPVVVSCWGLLMHLCSIYMGNCSLCAQNAPVSGACWCFLVEWINTTTLQLHCRH